MPPRPSGRQRVRMVFRDDDEDGQFTVTEVSPPVEGCAIQPQPGTETYDTGQQSRQRWAVHGPEVLKRLRPWDAVDLEHEPWSERWERASLDGRPAAWPGRGGHTHHVELNASVVAG